MNLAERRYKEVSCAQCRWKYHLVHTQVQYLCGTWLHSLRSHQTAQHQAKLATMLASSPYVTHAVETHEVDTHQMVEVQEQYTAKGYTLHLPDDSCTQKQQVKHLLASAQNSPPLYRIYLLLYRINSISTSLTPIGGGHLNIVDPLGVRVLDQLQFFSFQEKELRKSVWLFIIGGGRGIEERSLGAAGERYSLWWKQNTQCSFAEASSSSLAQHNSGVKLEAEALADS